MVTIESLVASGHLLREDRQSGGFQFYSRAGEASLLRGQRPSGAGAGGVVQAVAAGLSVRSAFGAAADARGGGERDAYRWFLGLRLPGQGAGRLDAEPEPAPALRRARSIRRSSRKPDRGAGGQEGLASGAVLYTDSTHPEGENANKNKYDLARVAVKPQEYLAARWMRRSPPTAHGKVPLKDKATTG